MSLKFVPPKAVGRYALFVDRPMPFFKSYDDLSSAKNAYRHKAGRVWAAKILENVDGEWFVLHDIPKGTRYNELPWVTEVLPNWRTDRIKYVAKPMTRDEYAEWRVKVAREQWNAEHKDSIKV